MTSPRQGVQAPTLNPLLAQAPRPVGLCLYLVTLGGFASSTGIWHPRWKISLVRSPWKQAEPLRRFTLNGAHPACIRCPVYLDSTLSCWSRSAGLAPCSSKGLCPRGGHKQPQDEPVCTQGPVQSLVTSRPLGSGSHHSSTQPGLSRAGMRCLIGYPRLWPACDFPPPFSDSSAPGGRTRPCAGCHLLSSGCHPVIPQETALGTLSAPRKQGSCRGVGFEFGFPSLACACIGPFNTLLGVPWQALRKGGKPCLPMGTSLPSCGRPLDQAASLALITAPECRIPHLVLRGEERLGEVRPLPTFHLSQGRTHLQREK
jgi:hypothetical protein